MSENRVIGDSGNIPWHLPEDFKWFKKTTIGGILIMGRKTYVISRTPQHISGVQVLSELSEIDEIETEKTIWIAGGGEIYKQMLSKCSELYLTRVHRTVKGDAFFPEFEDDFAFDSNIETNKDFTIERWLKR